MQADYSTVMPFIVAALLENRKRYEKRAVEIGEEKLFEEEPKARGYLRSRGGYRLFENREELCSRLNEDVKANREWLLDTLAYPLAGK
jgi:deoxyhypusine synthase